MNDDIHHNIRQARSTLNVLMHSCLNQDGMVTLPASDLYHVLQDIIDKLDTALDTNNQSK